jgi:hypothetical protein
MDRTKAAAAASLGVVVSRTVHEIVVGHTRLRVERDGSTGQHVYFVNDQRGDVNAYLAVTQAHLDRAESRLRNQ